MIISVQRGMSTLKDQLSSRGYKVVYSDEYNRPVDVFIYSGHYGYSSYERTPEIGCTMLKSIEAAAHNGGQGNGIIEINASRMSIHEIERMLVNVRNRLYY